jgi:opacity protein-like surface antigen
MKKFSLLASLLLGFVTASVQAGGEVYKQVAPPPPPPLYGTGFYGAIDAGANVFQNLGEHTFDRTDSDVFFVGDVLDSNVKLDPKSEVGIFGGIKLGYVFGTGVVRPTIEGDFFYNGFRAGFDVTANAAYTLLPGFPTINLGPVHGNLNSWINSGAFMGNFILRFAPGNQRFQPYVGAGVGAYYAETEGVNVEVEGFRTRVPKEFLRETAGTNEFADLAWQVIAGSDYYWTPKFSTFIEYHFLNYTSDTLVAVRDVETRRGIEQFKKEFNVNGSLGQHLVGVGVRFHF